jgi:hypothetical protein
MPHHSATANEYCPSSSAVARQESMCREGRDCGTALLRHYYWLRSDLIDPRQCPARQRREVSKVSRSSIASVKGAKLMPAGSRLTGVKW